MGPLYLALLFQPGGCRSHPAGFVVGDERMGSLAGRCNGVTSVRPPAAPVGAVLRHIAARDREEWVYGPRHPALALDDIADVTITQGPIAEFFDIGTVVIKSASGDQVLSLRGVREPEVIKTRIDALRA